MLGCSRIMPIAIVLWRISAYVRVTQYLVTLVGDQCAKLMVNIDNFDKMEVTPTN